MKISKRFLWGFVTGGFFLMFAAAIVIPQYTFFGPAVSRAYSYVSWIQEEIMERVEKSHLNRLPLNEVKVDWDSPRWYGRSSGSGEVTESGIIILRGDKEGPLVVAWPSFSETGVRWRCIYSPIRPGGMDFCKDEITIPQHLRTR